MVNYASCFFTKIYHITNKMYLLRFSRLVVEHNNMNNKDQRLILIESDIF
jgi:hypothetical protein